MNTLTEASMIFQHIDERLSKFEDKISQEVKTMIGCIADEMREFKDALNYFSGTCDDLREENKAMNNQIEVLKKENAEKTKEIHLLKTRSMEIEGSVSELDNYLRLNNIEIHGITLRQDEEPKVAVTKVLKQVDEDFKQQDIELCYPKGKRNNGEFKTPPSILVKLKSKEKRMKIYKQKKRLANVDFNAIGVQANNVFINENLSNHSKQLFFQANSLKKKHSWRFIWTTNGQIKVRRSTDTPIIIIRSAADLDKIDG